MAKAGSPDVTISYDSNDITQYVTDVNDIDIEAMMEETDTFGDSWTENTPVGMRKMGDIKLTGFYDDTATTGPDALFNVGSISQGPSSSAKNLVITYISGKTSTIPVFVGHYSRKLDRGKLHKYTVTLKPGASVTEA